MSDQAKNMKLLWFTNTPANATYYLTGSFGVGGSWVLAMEAMIKSQKNIDLALAFYWDLPKMEKFEVDGVTYYAIPMPTKNKLSRWMKRIRGDSKIERDVPIYLDIVKDYKPDLIHFFGSESAFGLIIPQLEVPSLIWIQGILHTVTRQWFAGISMLDVKKYTPLIDKIKVDTYISEYKLTCKCADRERIMLKEAEYVAGRTNWDRKTTSILAPKAKYYKVNELLREDFYHMEWQPHQGREQKILLTMMRDNLYKGLENIVECMQLLRPVFGENIQWRIAGLDPDLMVTRLVKKKFKIEYEELGIELLGSMSGEQIANELMNANIFVHPSHTDNSPNSVCEAMILGLPVISTYVGGIPDLITNGVDGILVDDGDYTALTATIMEVLNDDEKAVKIGKAARVRGLKRHDPQVILKDLLSVYEDMLKSSGKLVQDPKLVSI